MVQDPNLIPPEKEVITEDMNVDVLKIGNSTATSAGRTHSDLKLSVREGKIPLVPVYIPEGRVHGGSLMALLTAGSDLGSSRGKAVVASSEPMKSYMMPRGWI